MLTLVNKYNFEVMTRSPWILLWALTGFRPLSRSLLPGEVTNRSQLDSQRDAFISCHLIPRWRLSALSSIYFRA